MTRPPRFGAAFIGYHYLIAAAVAVGYGLAEYLTDRPHLLGQLGPPTRSTFYLSLAGTSGVLLGFSLTSIAIFTGLGSGRGMDFLRGTPGFAYTRTVFMGATRAFAVATVVLTSMIVADVAKEPREWLEAVTAGVLTLVVLRTWALLWLLNKLLDQTLKDAKVRYTRKVKRQREAA
jgi:hypothetical protein